MKKVLLIYIAFSSFSLFGANLRCDVSSLIDAQSCMDKLADDHVQYNLPNIGVASSKKDLLKKVLKSLNLDDKSLNHKVDTSDFIGVMLEKGDEWILYYYTIQRGKNVSVKPFYEINLVDIASELIFPLSAKDLILGDQFERFDKEDRAWIKDYLDLE